jgi:hypothetical protein
MEWAKGCNVSFGFGYCFTPTDTEAYEGRLVTLTDTSEPVDGNGAQNNYGQSGFRARELSITGPTRSPTALTGPNVT